MPDSSTLAPPTNVSVVELLLRKGKLTEAGLDRARRLQAESLERLEFVLTKLGLVSDRDLAQAMAAHLGVTLAAPQDFPEKPLFDDRLKRPFLKHARCIPLADTPAGVAVALVDPLDPYVVKALGFALARPVLPRVVLPADFEAAFERLYAAGKTAMGEISDSTADRPDGDVTDDAARLKEMASEAPVIRLVNLLITRAVESRASDIHIEPAEGRLRVRYRVDGVLQEVESPPPRLKAAIVSRVKIMAKLNIAERRLAQDGRIRVAVRGKDIDLRVSTVPAMHGESVVMRILDRGSLPLDFGALGFDAVLLERFLATLRQPHGILLVTGPTGSGKTTTLYTSLLTLNTPDKKILTIEDPIEYQLEGINQVQVKPQIGLTFAGALRSFLRQDPDIMMIGEIRDLETAQIAVQAALTGHLVLSTVHTNDAASAVTRLLDMGLEDYLLTSTINGLVGQRLVRTLCQNCREPYDALPEIVERLQLHGLGRGDGKVTLYRPVGCPHCAGSGYFGRTMIVEVLIMSDTIRQLVLKHAEAGEIQRAAIREGLLTMYQHGLQKCFAGVTTIEEVMRVTRDV